MAVVSSCISNPANTTFSLQLCLFVKNGCRHDWTDPKHLIALSHPWSFPNAALPRASSIALTPRLSQMVRANTGRGGELPFGTFSSTTLQSVTSEPAEPSLPEDGEGHSTNSYQPIPRDTLPECTCRRNTEKSTWRCGMAFTRCFLD